jgi:hypothetical protein
MLIYVVAAIITASSVAAVYLLCADICDFHRLRLQSTGRNIKSPDDGGNA